MPIAPQSLYSELWVRGWEQMSLKFSLKCSQTLWRRHFWCRRHRQNMFIIWWSGALVMCLRSGERLRTLRWTSLVQRCGLRSRRQCPLSQYYRIQYDVLPYTIGCVLDSCQCTCERLGTLLWACLVCGHGVSQTCNSSYALSVLFTFWVLPRPYDTPCTLPC